MASKPETHYAKGPGGDIAYQVVGDGPMIAERMPELGVEVRSGLHTGECGLRGDDIGGIAVHIGARVAALAGAGEVLVSNTVKDLVNDSGFTFRDRGTHGLKGLPGEWQLFSPSGQQDDPVESLLAASREV